MAGLGDDNDFTVALAPPPHRFTRVGLGFPNPLVTFDLEPWHLGWSQVGIQDSAGCGGCEGCEGSVLGSSVRRRQRG